MPPEKCERRPDIDHRALTEKEIGPIIGSFLDSRERHQYIFPRLPHDWLNILPQTRRIFTEINTLADSIANLDVLEPVIVAVYDGEGTKEYISLLSKAQGKEIKFEDLTFHNIDGRELCFILVDGERRWRACDKLMKEKCSDCLRKNGESGGGCYEHHVGDKRIITRLYVNPVPGSMIESQLSANVHVRVPLNQEANTYAGLFKLRRLMDPDIPPGKILESLAEHGGRNVDTIRIAIRYAKLPIMVQSLVDAGGLKYSIACWLSHLWEQLPYLDESQITYWAGLAVNNKWKPPQAEKIVKEFIAQERSGKPMELFTERERRLMEREALRREVSRDVALELITGMRWIVEKLHPALMRGIIPSVYVNDDLREALLSLGRAQRDFLANSNQLLKPKEIEEMVDSVGKIEEILGESLERESGQSRRELLLAQGG